jgi:hypothetical protein
VANRWYKQGDSLPWTPSTSAGRLSGLGDQALRFEPGSCGVGLAEGTCEDARDGTALDLRFMVRMGQRAGS